MKTSILKTMAVMLLCIPLLTGFSTVSALTHGSIKGVAIPLYTPGTTGGDITKPIAATVAVLDYKVVTIGSKSWVYTKFTGTANPDMSTYWLDHSQLRYWSGTTFSTKTQNNLFDVKNSTTKVVIGSTTVVPPSPLKISFYQDFGGSGLGESLQIPYDVTAKNSLIPSDNVVPVITASNSSALTETSATLNITGTDDSGDLFYYISGNGISQVSFLPSITLNGLTPGTVYNLTVTPIDFSGNEGIPANVQFTTVAFVQITSGIAQDIKFALKSTATTLEYYYEYTDGTKRFNNATLGITPAGGTAFNVTPIISPDSTYCYGTTNDGSINGKIITLNFKYTTHNSSAVTNNSIITSGPLTGTAIKHQMGSGPSPTESTPPVLNSVTLADATPNYIKLNIDGSDDSGTVYYTITGAKSTVNAYRTGNYFLTAIDPGHVYTLSVKPYDLSGNTATAKTLTVKTMSVRSNIKDSVGLAYSTTTIGVNNGEVTTIIQYTGSNLTIGETTKSLLIPTAKRNQTFNNSKVVINGTAYPLTMDANNTTATRTFTGSIGATPITTGLALTVQWTHNWGLTGGGAFNTGTFTYVVGDNGQTDVTGPSTPGISTGVNPITWPACTDDLSGVKAYIVSEYGQAPVTIFDLGGTTFTYTKVNNLNGVTVQAIDFVGNVSAVATDPGLGTANQQIALNSSVIYPNPATDRIYISGDVAKVSIYSLQGQHICSVVNTNTLNVSTLSKGLYLVKVIDKLGNQQSSKLEIR